MKRLPALVLAVVAFSLAACESPQKTVDQLRAEIATYKAAPSDAGQARIEAGLATLDTQIAKLESKGKTAEAAAYRSLAENLRADYRAARMVRTMKDAQSALQGIGEAVKEAGKSFGDAFRETPTPPLTVDPMEAPRRSAKFELIATGGVVAGAVTLGAVAIGACAVGAVAIGAVAIGRLAVGQLRIADLRVKRLEVDSLIVHQTAK